MCVSRSARRQAARARLEWREIRSYASNVGTASSEASSKKLHISLHSLWLVFSASLWEPGTDVPARGKQGNGEHITVEAGEIAK